MCVTSAQKAVTTPIHVWQNRPSRYKDGSTSLRASAASLRLWEAALTATRTAAAAIRRPLGPKGHPLVGHTLALAKDPLQFLASCMRDYGDMFFLRIRWLDVYVVCGQQGLDDVFIRQPGSFTLDRLSRGLRECTRRQPARYGWPDVAASTWDACCLPFDGSKWRAMQERSRR